MVVEHHRSYHLSNLSLGVLINFEASDALLGVMLITPPPTHTHTMQRVCINIVAEERKENWCEISMEAFERKIH